MSDPLAQDLKQTARSKIDQKFTDIKGILAPQSEIDANNTDQEIANTLKENTNKLRNLHAVGAQNLGGNSSGGRPETTAQASLTFDTNPRPDIAPPKSEPNATLTTQQIAIANELSGLGVGRSTSLPSSRPPATGGLPGLNARRYGLSKPLPLRSPSASPSSPSSQQGLVDRVIDALGPNSPAGKDLQVAKENFAELREEQKELRRQQILRRRNSNRNGRGGSRVNR
jgi:hypothetical protein